MASGLWPLFSVEPHVVVLYAVWSRLADTVTDSGPIEGHGLLSSSPISIRIRSH